MSVTAAPVLHVPDEPLVLAEAWREAVVVAGRDLEAVLRADDGLAAWLWSRWSSLAIVGVGEQDLANVVTDYRREVWLWLAGERTWVQCCSGLIGRINRRLTASDLPQG
jgi:hypothetical protein